MGKAFKDLFTFSVTLELAPNFLAIPTTVVYTEGLTPMQTDHCHHRHHVAFGSLESHKTCELGIISVYQMRTQGLREGK